MELVNTYTITVQEKVNADGSGQTNFNIVVEHPNNAVTRSRVLTELAFKELKQRLEAFSDSHTKEIPTPENFPKPPGTDVKGPVN
jgi:hypothetical protein